MFTPLLKLPHGPQHDPEKSESSDDNLQGHQHHLHLSLPTQCLTSQLLPPEETLFLSVPTTCCFLATALFILSTVLPDTTMTCSLLPLNHLSKYLRPSKTLWSSYLNLQTTIPYHPSQCLFLRLPYYRSIFYLIWCIFISLTRI